MLLGKGKVSWGAADPATLGLSVLLCTPPSPLRSPHSLLTVCERITEPNPCFFSPLLLKYTEPQSSFLKSCQLANQISQTISVPVRKNQKKTQREKILTVFAIQ